MKKIILIAALLASPALAQTVTDEELKTQTLTCSQINAQTHGNMPDDKKAKCQAVFDEIKKRLDAKHGNEPSPEHKALDDIVKRLAK